MKNSRGAARRVLGAKNSIRRKLQAAGPPMIKALDKLTSTLKVPAQAVKELFALAVSGLVVLSIVDTTPIPHNGCRPPKRPRG